MRLNNARVLTEDGALRVLSLRVENGRVAELSGSPFDGGADMSRHIIAPGYIDLHIHGYGGVDTMEGGGAVDIMRRALVKHGVTGFTPTTMCAPDEDTYNALKGVSAAMDAGDGARVLGAHIEGRLINAARKGAQRGDIVCPPSMDVFNAMTRDLAGCVRMMTIAPELEGAEAFIRELSGRGIVMSCGHSDATYEQFMASVPWGISHVTHQYNGMNPLTQRAPGVPCGGLMGDVTVQLIADGIHIHPALLALTARVKGARRIALITDAMMATGLGDGTYALGGQEVFVRGGVARLESGVLASSTLTMDKAVDNMVHMVGVPLEDALIMASRTPAEALGIDDLGVLRAGARADFVVLDGELNVRATVVRGRAEYLDGIEI